MQHELAPTGRRTAKTLLYPESFKKLLERLEYLGPIGVEREQAKDLVRL